ncbi:MAG: hypothetical protein EX272_06775 [Chromatiales bacterium]|nr:MAG: hypothetical protein EX272_06775 [Chromatiales bacterium]
MKNRWLTMPLMTVAAVLLVSPALAQEPNAPSQPDVQPAAANMSEELRASVSKIVILATEGANSETVTGTYRNKTPGFFGGMAKGAELGTFPVEVGGVPIGIPIPILREIGMIAGAITGKSERELQEFRDRLTQDLRAEVDQPLTNDALANDVFWGLKEVSTLEPKILALTTPIPEDTEAVLFVALTDLSLNIQGNKAIITTTASMRLDNAVDGTTLYRREVTYQDQDKLSKWVDNDTQLWHEYRNFARHYIGREIPALLYGRIDVKHEVLPAESDSIQAIKKDTWRGKTKSRTPTLVWNSGLEDTSIEPASVTWDVEIYSRERPVYNASGVRGTSHTVTVPLEVCGDLYWSVRPTYEANGVSKVGRWMRKADGKGAGSGNAGRSVSAAHAYIQDFASFDLKCR